MPIVIPSATPALVTRILGALDVGDRVVVVANHDDADVRAAVAEAATRGGAEAIVARKNVGFSGACNMGARLHPDEHVILLNDDVIPGPGLVQKLEGSLRWAEIVGAKLYRPNGVVDHAGTSMEGLTWRHITRDAGGCPLVQGVTFAAVAIDNTVWRRLGGLEERLWYACEDQDFCLRALQRGYSIRCDREATAVHDQSQTRRPAEVDGPAREQLARLWDPELIARVLRDYARQSAPEEVET